MCELCRVEWFKFDRIFVKTAISEPTECLGPYHVESTSSRPITEVKQHWAALVLGWMTASKDTCVKLIISLVGKWADPGGTAIPGQPVTEPEQAPGTLSPYKNQFNIEGGTWPPYQILS